MNSGVTAERVYDALKARLLSGEILPGERLEPKRFAEELASSVTPVRDALNRLSGERIVDTRTADGFHLPLMSEPVLRDLYQWNGQLLRLASQAWCDGTSWPRADTLAADRISATCQLFELFGRRSNQVEHLAQIISVNDRLQAARIAETRVLEGIEAEIRAMAVGFDREAPPVLLRLVRAYHRRRTRAVPAIVRAIYHR